MELVWLLGAWFVGWFLLVKPSLLVGNDVMVTTLLLVSFPMLLSEELWLLLFRFVPNIAPVLPHFVVWFASVIVV